jgi:hypothetical protein
MYPLRTSDRDRGVEELKRFHNSFHSFFRVNTPDVIKPSLQYQQGLLFGEKSKTMTNMEMTVPDGDLQSLQTSIAESDVDSDELPGRESWLIIRKDDNEAMKYQCFLKRR